MVVRKAFMCVHCHRKVVNISHNNATFDVILSKIQLDPKGECHPHRSLVKRILQSRYTTVY